jgi:hypothetical protein
VAAEVPAGLDVADGWTCVQTLSPVGLVRRRGVGEEPSRDASVGIVRALRSAGAGVVRVIEAQSSG